MISKYLKYIILLAFLATVIIYYNKSADYEMKQSAEDLYNNIEFEGYITGFKRSDNHAFGVIYLKLTKRNVSEFDKILKKGIYPYKIKGNIGELYCTVSIERKKGDFIKLISNHETVYYNPQNSNKEKGSIFIIKDPYNIDFVRRYTKFK